MSGTTKKWIAYVGGTVFAVASALIVWSAGPAHPHPLLHEYAELAVILLGATGITAPISVLAPADKS